MVGANTVMAMDEETERRGFRVTDRRRFVSEDAATPEAERPASAVDVPVSFTTFVLGLGTQTLLHLGEIVDPDTGPAQRDLPAAKHMIDMLAILQDKTRNNLDPGESEILGSMLYDLRMRYVALVRGTTEKEKA